MHRNNILYIRRRI